MPPKGWRKPKEEEASVPIVVTPQSPHIMVKCACGCPNHPQAVRCAACSRVLAK